jgi:hypothetical protein
VVIVAIVLIIIFVGGSGSSKPRTTASQSGAQRYHEISIPALAGVTSVSAKALLTPVAGTSVRLTINAVSHYAYTAVLITPPTKTEALISNVEGRSQFIHRLTLQHLLGYKYLRIYTLTPATRQLRPALQIPTTVLAEGIIAKPNG